ncbi:MAG TPA: UDP-N-acetylmuramoyl-L-alanine--D-glutamate ligase [Patescibacteria group bacterium]|nr:UDP-N-acetylmuramoyl-L-alanine--D-glutamate ligase [Patescibacteria group bacterium]
MNKKVAIAGFGIEGHSAYKYFAAQGGYDMTIADEHPISDVPSGAKQLIGKDIFAELTDFDIVVRTPSIRPDRIKANGEITSTVKKFFEVCPSKNIIGVTGSKGKGTITTLIYKMLQAAGKRVHIGGNIGVPVLDMLDDIKPDDIVVLELSSFQLWDLHQSPHIAVVGMIAPDHLDVHTDFDEYLAAKSNIARWQKPGDFIIYHPTNVYARRIAEKSPATFKFRFGTQEAAYIDGDRIVIEGYEVCKLSDVNIPGAHNLENICAAISAAWQLVGDDAAFREAIRGFREAIKDFKGLNHRLQLVRTVDGVKYYDDSFATTPDSAIVALRAFIPPKIIILGGSDKGADFDELAAEVAKQDIRQAILIGNMRFKLQTALKRVGFEDVRLFDEQSNMNEIVGYAHKIARPGDVVLLSPACASFDMFKNYNDRGDQFIASVRKL